MGASLAMTLSSLARSLAALRMTRMGAQDDGGQKTEGRRHRAEDIGQKTEGRRQKAAYQEIRVLGYQERKSAGNGGQSSGEVEEPAS